jgi:hypothetical protein
MLRMKNPVLTDPAADAADAPQVYLSGGVRALIASGARLEDRGVIRARVGNLQIADVAGRP